MGPDRPSLGVLCENYSGAHGSIRLLKLVKFSRNGTAAPRIVRTTTVLSGKMTNHYCSVPFRQVSSTIVAAVLSAEMPIRHLSLLVSKRSSVVPALTPTACFNCLISPIQSELDSFGCSYGTSTPLPPHSPRTHDSPSTIFLGGTLGIFERL